MAITIFNDSTEFGKALAIPESEATNKLHKHINFLEKKAMPNPNNITNPNKHFLPSRKTPQQMRDDMQDARLKIIEKELELRKKNDEREHKRTNAIMGLITLQADVRSRTLNWQIAAKHIGSAYVVAYNKHKDVLGKQAAKDALNAQVVFSILTVLSAGSLAWIGLSNRFDQLLKDIVEDAAQAGVGEVLSAIGPMAYPLLSPPTGGPVGVEPQIYQNSLEIKILSATRNIEENFKTIIQGLRETPIEKWDMYDEKKQKERHDIWKKKAAQFAGVEDLPIDQDGQPNVKMMAEELERAIWAKYILSQRYYRDWGLFKTRPQWEYAGDEVYDRLAELGVELKKIEKDARLEMSKSGSINSRDFEIDVNLPRTICLYKWAKDFEPKSFATMRREQEKLLSKVIKAIPHPILKFFGDQRGR